MFLKKGNSIFWATNWKTSIFTFKGEKTLEWNIKYNKI